MKGFTLGLGWALCLLVLTGCVAYQHPQRDCARHRHCGQGQETELTVVDVRTKSDTNAGRPFYMLLRPVDRDTCDGDSYSEVAHKVFHRPVDWPVLLSEVIFPGKEQRFEVRHPKDQSVAVYFLFTDPGKRWKSWVESPGKQVTLYLDDNQIEDVL